VKGEQKAIEEETLTLTGKEFLALLGIEQPLESFSVVIVLPPTPGVRESNIVIFKIPDEVTVSTRRLTSRKEW
jgi:hypothetical protein